MMDKNLKSKKFKADKRLCSCLSKSFPAPVLGKKGKLVCRHSFPMTGEVQRHFNAGFCSSIIFW